ncbi:PspC domain-containing protein [Paenibacillus pini]|uniref:Phage shock protein PspC N-terminal domain-containing protein n=1 Tax=Paenibacillus pini JCM 16418 TaxID=1236976 RepID=W7YZX2_9BACL|nr:PspC domain-containing protein [Paenibacillus pini]GAF07939.1 hypothetical protein JCM16418_1973 [Paenibacillus pini JCM 16418]
MSKLYRSTRNKMVTGLCGGLSENIGINTTLLRVLLLGSVPFTGGTTVFIYFIAALVIPKEPVIPYNPFGPGPQGPGGYYGNGYGHSTGGDFGRYQSEPQAANGPFGSQSQSYDLRGQFNGSSFSSTPNGYKSQASDLDSMMEDIEKKAMKKELEDLKRKLSKYEKGEV